MHKIKLQRGQKLCKNCEQPNASRQRECKWCGTAFISKNTKLKGENAKDLFDELFGDKK